MEKTIYKAESRGESALSWLKSKFSFSFAGYYEPARMGFGKLRVLNDDVIAEGQGFGSHPHKNMEIITIVLDGELEHKDSTGAVELANYGDIQVMSAGSGIMHSEFNHSSKKKLKLLQIWIETEEKNIKPRHDKKSFDFKKNGLIKIVSGDITAKDSLYIHQDARMFIGAYDSKKSLIHNLEKNKGVFIFLIDGELDVEGETLHKRDAISLTDTSSVNIKVNKNVRFVIIEVPMK